MAILSLVIVVFLFVSVARCSQSDSNALHTFQRKFKAKILAFGDSLTHGVVVESETYTHSYAIQLQKELNHSCLEVAVSGNPGEPTHSMVNRLPNVLSEMSTLKLAIILGGTNDIIKGRDPHRVLDNLIKMHQMVHNISHSDPVLTIALGIPESRVNIMNHTSRATINRGLKAYAQRCEHLVYYRDFEERFNQSVPENRIYWSKDTIHFSVLGYDEIGHLLHDDIVQFVHRVATSQKPHSVC